MATAVIESFESLLSGQRQHYLPERQPFIGELRAPLSTRAPATIDGQRTLLQTSTAYPRSASASSLPRLGLCLSFLACFLFSARFTGLGVPSTARDAAFTALVALNFLSFFFFGTIAI